MEAARRGSGVKIVEALVEKNEQNLTHAGSILFEMPGDAIERDFGRFLGRIAIGAGADGWKANGSRAALAGQFETFPIATAKLGRFVVLPVLINRPNGVNHILGRERTGRGNDGAARWTIARGTADLIEFAHDRGSTGTMYGAIHSATSAQSGIRCIDDGVDSDLGDVADDQPEFLPVRKINLHASMVAVGA